MPNSDSWPGSIAMESLINVDSAGSCESVISMNSGYSEDSMEHLSAEERACLMYLEETIEALEVQEDSGLSNDEPDFGLQAGEVGQGKVNDPSNLMFKFPKEEHQTSEPKSRPVSETNRKAVLSSADLLTQPKHPLTRNIVPSSAPSTKVVCVTTDANGNPKIVTSSSLHRVQTSEASEVDPSLIPPPSDFMDETQEVKYFPPPADSSNNKSVETVDLEQLRRRASGSSSLAQESPSVPSPEVPPCPSPLAVTSGYLRSPNPEPAVPRSPPAVAPKPKKLPANIIQKSYRSSWNGSEGNTGPFVSTSSDRVLSDHQRVHMEALRKLGLLKNEESESGPALSPRPSPSPSQSPGTRRSWGTPPSPISPAAPQTPPLTPSNTFVNSPPPVFVPQSLPAVTPPDNPSAPELLPAPEDFSDPADTAVADVSEDNRNCPTLKKHLTPPKMIGVKSATLERLGLGLSSATASEDSSTTGQRRKSRPRPASLGSGKELSGTRGEIVPSVNASRQNQDSRRSLPAHDASKHSRDSKKLPRSEGISVLICPRSENEEDRRKALRKLGLLRD